MYLSPMRYITRLFMIVIVLGMISCEKKAEEKEPVAAFYVDPVAAPFTTVFIFDASETHNEGESADALTVRWDYDGDGIFDTEFSKTKIKSHRYDKAGDFNVRMEVMNSMGWTDSEVFPISVYHDSVPPVAAFSAEPDTSCVGTIFYFNAAESWDAYTPKEELQFRWDWDGDEVWDTPFCADTCKHYKFNDPGEYRVRMEVRNEINLSDTTSQKIFVFDI